jgi:hypothetical protein
MKRLIVALCLAALAGSLMPGCQKTSQSNAVTPEPEFVKAAQSYFEQQWEHAPPAAESPNPRNTGNRIPDWTRARVTRLSNADAVIVPVHYSKPFYLGTNWGGIRQFMIDDITQLLIYRDSTKSFHAEMITLLPDSSYKDGPPSSFKGMVLVDHWNGQSLARYKYDGQSVRAQYPGRIESNSSQTRQADALVIETCYEIVGYNYPASNPNDGYAWQEDAGCTYSFISEVPSMQLLNATGYLAVATNGGSGGVGVTHSAMYPGDGGIVDGSQLQFIYDTLPGIDLSKYFKCFTYIPDQGATYSVTICADIPVDGNSGALLTTSFHPGHAFIILTKTNGTVSLSQSFGFYPESQKLSITGMYIQSKIKDDGLVNHEYDASYTLPNVSQLDFQTVENMAVNLAGSQKYSLYNYNCTNYALQVFNSILPNTPIAVSDWIGSYTGIDFGKTPNGLYETLVAMKTFAGGVNNLNISVGPKYAPFSSGSCN